MEQMEIEYLSGSGGGGGCDPFALVGFGRFL